MYPENRKDIEKSNWMGIPRDTTRSANDLMSVIDLLASYSIISKDKALNQQTIALKLRIPEGCIGDVLKEGQNRDYLVCFAQTRPKINNEFFGVGGIEKVWYLTEEGQKIASKTQEARLLQGQIGVRRSGPADINNIFRKPE